VRHHLDERRAVRRPHPVHQRRLRDRAARLRLPVAVLAAAPGPRCPRPGRGLVTALGMLLLLSAGTAVSRRASARRTQASSTRTCQAEHGEELDEALLAEARHGALVRRAAGRGSRAACATSYTGARPRAPSRAGAARGLVDGLLRDPFSARGARARPLDVAAPRAAGDRDCELEQPPVSVCAAR
jgi:hypothetical protein